MFFKRVVYGLSLAEREIMSKLFGMIDEETKGNIRSVLQMRRVEISTEATEDNKRPARRIIRGIHLLNSAKMQDREQTNIISN